MFPDMDSPTSTKPARSGDGLHRLVPPAAAEVCHSLGAAEIFHMAMKAFRKFSRFRGLL